MERILAATAALGYISIGLIMLIEGNPMWFVLFATAMICIILMI